MAAEYNVYQSIINISINLWPFKVTLSSVGLMMDLKVCYIYRKIVLKLKCH